MDDRGDSKCRVLAHSTAALGFFLGFVFLPKLIPRLQESTLFFWIAVLGSVASFVLTNLVLFRSAQSQGA